MVMFHDQGYLKSGPGSCQDLLYHNKERWPDNQLASYLRNRVLRWYKLSFKNPRFLVGSLFVRPTRATGTFIKGGWQDPTREVYRPTVAERDGPIPLLHWDPELFSSIHFSNKWVEQSIHSSRKWDPEQWNS